MPLTAQCVNDAVAELWSEVGCECVDIGPAHAVARTSLAGVSLRPGGYVPGPVQFAIADACLWYLAFGALDRIEPMALTSELSIRFLRPGTGEMLWCRATLDRSGRRAMVGTVRVWTDANEHRPCATGQGTYMLPDR